MKPHFALGCLLLLGLSLAFGKTVTFKGASVAGLDLDLLNPNLWEGEVTPASGDDFVFPGTSAYNVSFLDWDVQVGSLLIGGDPVLRQRLILSSRMVVMRGITLQRGSTLELNDNATIADARTNNDVRIIVGNFSTLVMNQTDGVANVSLPITVNATGALLITGGSLHLTRPCVLQSNANCSIDDSGLLLIMPNDTRTKPDLVVNANINGTGRILLDNSADMVWADGNITTVLDVSKNATLNITTASRKTFDNIMNIDGALFVPGTFWLAKAATLTVHDSGNATLFDGGAIQWDNSSTTDNIFPLIDITGNWTSQTNTTVAVPFRNSGGNVTIENRKTLASPGTAGFLSNTNSFVQQDGRTELFRGPTVAVEQLMDIRNGLLLGNGTIIASRVQVAGTLSPGFSPGQININGDLIMTPISKYIVDIVGDTAADRDLVLVNGNANIQGGTLVVNTPASFVSTLSNVTVMEVTSATGNLTGRFANVDTTNSAVDVVQQTNNTALVLGLVPKPFGTTSSTTTSTSTTTGVIIPITSTTTTTGFQNSAVHVVASWGIVFSVFLGMLL